jgi:hypothetical protein
VKRKKMKNYLLITLILICSTVVHGQDNLEKKEKARMAANKIKKQTQWAYDYVDGKPSSKGYISCVTSYDKSGNAIEIVNYKGDGKITSILNYAYDAKGNKTSYTRYQGNREKLTYSQKITYDAKGCKLTETGFDGVSNYVNYFRYEGGKLVEIKYTTDNLVTEKRAFKYDGANTEISILNADNQAIAKEVNIYDSKKNLIEESRFANQDVTQKKQYQYDVKGQVVEETKHRYGNFSYKKKYYYDGAGNLLKVEDIKADGKAEVTNSYDYDAKGNILEEKWRKENSTDDSYKKYVYNDKGLYTSMDCYFASYKFSVLYKFTYDTF